MAAGVQEPVRHQKEDRSQPPLLNSIQDLSRYVAAEGNFQVIIDVQENRKYIPDFLVNDRMLFVAAGTVDAYVDFSNIGEGAIKASDDRRTVEVTLPEPQLGKPNLDPENSAGVLAAARPAQPAQGRVLRTTRTGWPRCTQLAEERIAEAAKRQHLGERAKENTKKMLEGLLRSLGYTSVITIAYKAPRSSPRRSFRAPAHPLAGAWCCLVRARVVRSITRAYMGRLPDGSWSVGFVTVTDRSGYNAEATCLRSGCATCPRSFLTAPSLSTG